MSCCTVSSERGPRYLRDDRRRDRVRDVLFRVLVRDRARTMARRLDVLFAYTHLGKKKIVCRVSRRYRIARVADVRRDFVPDPATHHTRFLRTPV